MTKKILRNNGYFAFSLLVALVLYFGINLTNIQAVETIPDFTVETLDGTFTLSENLGKTVVLFFSFPG